VFGVNQFQIWFFIEKSVCSVLHVFLFIKHNVYEVYEGLDLSQSFLSSYEQISFRKKTNIPKERVYPEYVSILSL